MKNKRQHDRRRKRDDKQKASMKRLLGTKISGRLKAYQKVTLKISFKKVNLVCIS